MFESLDFKWQSDVWYGANSLGGYAGPDSVQTPREVYENLTRQGYRVEYHRLPLTDGKAPQPSAFDAIYDGVSKADPHCPVIINCQMGGGRTTTAMVVACLVRNATFGNFAFP